MSKKNTIGYTESDSFMCLEDLEQTKRMEIVEPLKLNYCGREICSPGNSFGPYVRHNYVIHFVLSGRGIYRVGKKRFEVRENQAFLICPDDECTYTADDKNPWNYAWIGFGGYQAESVIREIGFSKDDLVIDLKDTDEINRMISVLLETRDLTFANELKRKSVLYDILNRLVCNNEKVEKEEPSDDYCALYVRKAVEKIISSYNKKLKISDIADDIGINRSYLTNIFKKEMKMSPQDFLICFRLEKAAELLKDTNYSISDVAARTGYEDALSFSKAFKKKFHMTPTAYRNLNPVLSMNHEKGSYVNIYPL